MYRNSSPKRRRSPVRRKSSPAMMKSPTRRRSSPARKSSPARRRSSPARRKSSPARRKSSPARRRSKQMFSYGQESDIITTLKSLDVKSLVDVRTLSNLSDNTKLKILKSIVFFSTIETDFFNTFINNIEKSRSPEDFIERCKNIKMSDLTKLNLCLYVYQVLLLVKNSSKSGIKEVKFGMEAKDEYGELIDANYINNPDNAGFTCPICLGDYLDDRLEIIEPMSTVCGQNHVYHTKCISNWKKTRSRAGCPLCGEDMVLNEIISIIDRENNFTMLRKKKDGFRRKTLIRVRTATGKIVMYSGKITLKIMGKILRYSFEIIVKISGKMLNTFFDEALKCRLDSVERTLISFNCVMVWLMTIFLCILFFPLFSAYDEYIGIY